jgi:hypothetical protein
MINMQNKEKVIRMVLFSIMLKIKKVQVPAGAYHFQVQISSQNVS